MFRRILFKRSVFVVLPRRSFQSPLPFKWNAGLTVLHSSALGSLLLNRCYRGCQHMFHCRFRKFLYICNENTRNALKGHSTPQIKVTERFFISFTTPFPFTRKVYLSVFQAWFKPHNFQSSTGSFLLHLSENFDLIENTF